jgi:CRISPR/Cas system-associated endonuclease/helicase Cas3
MLNYNSLKGKVGTVCGFSDLTINFSAKKVMLFESSYSVSSSASSSKWSKIIDRFPRIRKITATIRQNAPLIGSDTIHFHGASEFQDMVNAAKAVGSRSDLAPKRYQWRAYFFSCLNNTLLCLPTGMGKTLIANMLMKAYQQRNPLKGQVFVVPTVVLVSFKFAHHEILDFIVCFVHFRWNNKP